MHDSNTLYRKDRLYKALSSCCETLKKMNTRGFGLWEFHLSETPMLDHVSPWLTLLAQWASERLAKILRWASERSFVTKSIGNNPPFCY